MKIAAMPDEKTTRGAEPAQISLAAEGGEWVVGLRGQWRLTGALPSWPDEARRERPGRVVVTMAAVTGWDSALPMFVYRVQSWCRVEGVPCDLAALPEAVRRMVAEFGEAQAASVPKDRRANFLSGIGEAALDAMHQGKDFIGFIGECAMSAGRLARRPARFRWRDCLEEMQKCGAMALPIVSLVSFLVGVTLAYTGAIILRLFGGDIWVADLVGLSTTREMAPVMTAVVLAGRTGAAYAAQLGNMKANEEIDALATLGVSPVDFLVVPRLVALAVMTPLLALYCNCLGILGGMVIARGILDIPPTAYWVEMLTIVDLSDVNTGLLKASTFGLIVGVSGCLRGLQADRSAAGVGQAATSAVVTTVLWVVVADALYAVLFNFLGW